LFFNGNFSLPDVGLVKSPVESSSLLIHSTNGAALPKTLIVNKVSRSGKIVQVVPEYEKFKDNYKKLLMWEQDSPIGYLKTVAVLQVYIDQAISSDMFYNPKEIQNPITGVIEFKIDVNEFLSHMILAQNWGIKTLYYCLINKQKVIDRLKNSEPMKDEPVLVEDEHCEGCTI
jgi:ribonucleotide reductase alpha subunit